METGGVLDEQITASSELNDDSAAYLGRLNDNESVQGSTVKSGAWVAGTSDQSQWLQVDLYDEDSLLNRVATQGRTTEKFDNHNIVFIIKSYDVIHLLTTISAPAVDTVAFCTVSK